ncbi:unnamed protein product [Rotaria magnacalcarata]|uniref:Uncharacterized protein n=1 Tax=Rotaria magnacalcarata TaxID=392030 RepID=A0A816M7I1_9BILA|nr:unnamed protein product [Rotaria magnacalcarata]CAF1977703.1 unnamed protein product [Rotaria magnacalcarata]
MSTDAEISVAAANTGELNKPKPRWMPLEENPETIVTKSIIPILSQVHAIFILKDDDDAHVTSGQKMSDDTTFGKSHIASLSRQPPKPKMATVDRSVSPDSVNPSFQQNILAEIS